MSLTMPQKIQKPAGETRQPKTVEDCLEMLKSSDRNERSNAVWALAKAVNDLGVGQLHGKEKEVTDALFKLLKSDETDTTKLGALNVLREMVQKESGAARLVREGLGEHIQFLVKKVREENDDWAKTNLVRIAKFSPEVRKSVLAELDKFENEAKEAGDEGLARRAHVLAFKARHESRELAPESETPTHL